MKRMLQRLGAGSALLLIVSLPMLEASALNMPPAQTIPAGLAISEVKITGSEFILLQNNTGRRSTI